MLAAMLGALPDAMRFALPDALLNRCPQQCPQQCPTQCTYVRTDVQRMWLTQMGNLQAISRAKKARNGAQIGAETGNDAAAKGKCGPSRGTKARRSGACPSDTGVPRSEEKTAHQTGPKAAAIDAQRTHPLTEASPRDRYQAKPPNPYPR